MGHSTRFSCTYNASSVPNLTITRWSVNGVVIPHNTSQFTLITEYGIYELDEVKSTLIISNVNYGNDGTYTCWCEYNSSLIFNNKLFRSAYSSVRLKVTAAGEH